VTSEEPCLTGWCRQCNRFVLFSGLLLVEALPKLSKCPRPCFEPKTLFSANPSDLIRSLAIVGAMNRLCTLLLLAESLGVLPARVRGGFHPMLKLCKEFHEMDIRMTQLSFCR
jgi:hypothetical protein